jgi:hypothetical protein
MAKCKYCGKNVTWMKEGRKNVPVEDDGNVHKCENFDRSRSSIREIKPSELDPELIKQYEENIKKAKK